VIAGPLYGEEGIVDDDCDPRPGRRAKRWFDSVGRYSREDVLLDKLDRHDPVGADPDLETLSTERP
jgi:hypothetical protein